MDQLSVNEVLWKSHEEALERLFQGKIYYHEVRVHNGTTKEEWKVEALFPILEQPDVFCSLEIPFTANPQGVFLDMGAPSYELFSIDETYDLFHRGLLKEWETTLIGSERYQWIMKLYEHWRAQEQIISESWWATIRDAH